MADVAQLSKLERLKTLSLHSTEIDATALQHLSKMTSLRELCLWSTKVTPEEIAAFRETHPEIHVVY